MTLFGVYGRVVSKRVVSADVPQERKPERGYVRQNHPFTKPPFYLPVRFSIYADFSRMFCQFLSVFLFCGWRNSSLEMGRRLFHMVSCATRSSWSAFRPRTSRTTNYFERPEVTQNRQGPKGFPQKGYP